MAASELPRATVMHAGENPSPVAADVGSSSVYMPDARHVNPKAKMVTAAGDGIAADQVRFVADLAVLGTQCVVYYVRKREARATGPPIVLKLARHQWDMTVCWFDASYLLVGHSRNDASCKTCATNHNRSLSPSN